MATQKKSAKKSSTRAVKTSSRTKASKETKDMQSTGLPDSTRSTAALAATADTSSATAIKENDWRKRFFIPLIIVLLAVLAYVGMQQLVVATVNGVPVSRITLLKEMESQIGEQVLDSLITRQLIVQEAKKQKKILSSNAKWFSLEQVELVRMPDKRVGWVVGKDCETLRIVMALDSNRIHLFDQDEVTLTANEKTAA